MCGIVGLLSIGNAIQKEEIEPLIASLRLRGPDDSGVWLEERGRVAMGHTRLAILDLSPLGHQPMVSQSGRYTITFNGEVYNFGDLRSDLRLQGFTPKGGSDTEILLAAFEQWGIEETLRRVNGMLAIGVWDRAEEALYLARDKVGKKPLYYGAQGQRFWFGSELKALRAKASDKQTISRQALSSFVSLGYVPSTECIYEGFHKLPAGAYLKVHLNGLRTIEGKLSIDDLQPRKYWDFSTLINSWRDEIDDDSKFQSEGELVEQCDSLLRSAVSIRCVADVPLGAFLSGGIDSSLVVALMQTQRTDKVRTYAIGFEENGYDEAPFARQIAEYLGCDHHEHYVSGSEALSVVPLLPKMFDEPFADASQIPTFLVSKFARSDVTVALSGDGGDELFGGYSRYVWLDNIWRRSRSIPHPMRAVLSAMLRIVPPALLTSAYETLRPVLPHSLSFKGIGEKIHRTADVLCEKSFEQFYVAALQYWKPELLLAELNVPHTCVLGDSMDFARQFSPQDRMMCCDFQCYLPDDVLVKVDRASMANSLETRAPLLDPRLVEFCWKLAPGLRINGTQTKHLLRKVLAKYVPPALFERPKSGFAVPIEEWLRGPLKSWMCDLLSPERIRKQGIFNPELVASTVRDHLSGERDARYLLWILLSYQSWAEEWGVG